jgi:hypothetical protein
MDSMPFFSRFSSFLALELSTGMLMIQNRLSQVKVVASMSKGEDLFYLEVVLIQSSHSCPNEPFSVRYLLS